MLAQGLLPIMEQFYSLQGEGAHSGRAAHFVRLAGCDVGCVWCDVKESWNVDQQQYTKIDAIVNECKIHSKAIVVVTGGEPCIYNLDNLCKALHKENFNLHLETSGAYPISGKWDWVCLSPKKFKSPLKECLAKAHELKVVIFNASDFDWALEHAAHVRENCRLFLQPEWSKAEKMTAPIIEFIQENPQWELSLQTHKYLGVR
ncbi:UNVERIFIED_CONTAM: hypothetical protein GTU68_012124 [Idotea baltica]|nr:hypothetical protein [Idotea baltica]